MCVSAMALGAGLSAASSIAGAAGSGAAAGAEASWTRYQLAVQNKQLREEIDATRLKASNQEVARLEMDRKQRATNEAFLAASGLASSESFDQGIDPDAARKAGQDVTAIHYNARQQVSRMKDQIAVNNANIQFAGQKAKMTRQAAWMKGGLDAGASLIKGYNDFDAWSS